MSIVLETLIRHFEREPNAVMWPNGIALRHGEIAAVLRHHALPVADRIRELESQQAAVRDRWASVVTALEGIGVVFDDADVQKVRDTLTRFIAPSAAAVSVTEAMVKAANAAYHGASVDDIKSHYDPQSWAVSQERFRAALTAALTAASEDRNSSAAVVKRAHDHGFRAGRSKQSAAASWEDFTAASEGASA